MKQFRKYKIFAREKALNLILLIKRNNCR